MSKKRIAILTTFQDFDSAYSLVNIALDQCRMLKKYGYEYTIFVNEEFNKDDLAKYSSEFNVSASMPIAYGMTEDIIIDEFVDRLTEAYYEALKDFDVVLTHDIMFQGWFISHNKAVRNVIPKLPNIRWFHWVHSAPGARSTKGYPVSLRYNKAPNAKYVYLNHDDRLRFAEYIGGNTEDVRIVYNPLDLRDFYEMHEDSVEIIDRYDLMSADIMQVYPFSCTRMRDKGVHKIIAMFGAFKKYFNKNVKLVLCNAHTTRGRERQAVEEMVQLAEKHGLTEEEVIFTSRYKPERPEEGGWTYSTPHRVIRDLLKISNIFIFPTVSEACSKVLLEASSAGCYMVLNGSFKPMKEFANQNAVYHDFGSLRENVDHGEMGEDKWLEEVAKATMPGFLAEKSIAQKTYMKQKFNIDYIFRHQLEPLFYEEWE